MAQLRSKPLLASGRNHRTCILAQLANITPTFAITNNNGQNFTTSMSAITLAGAAPVEVKFLRLNSATTNALVTWTSVTNWSLGLTLTNGANPITVQGYGRTNNLLSSAVDSITITYQP